MQLRQKLLCPLGKSTAGGKGVGTSHLSEAHAEYQQLLKELGDEKGDMGSLSIIMPVVK